MSISTHAPQKTNWRPKAIVFDLLTGLLDSWSLWDASTPSAGSAEGRAWRKRYLEITFNAGTYVPYEDLAKVAANDVGLPPSAPANLLRDWEKQEGWPENAKVLLRLKELDYKLGVVTDCSTRLGHVAAGRACAGAGNDIFDAVITAEESGFYKPVPEAYQAILKKMGLDAQDVLFVAGSAGDVQGAMNVGMRVVWHNKIGLPKAGNAIPLREAMSLDGALHDFL